MNDITTGRNAALCVFVYGSLMQGQYNHSYYLSTAEFIGIAEAEGFAMYNLGGYPGAVHADDECIRGEVYAIDQKTLRRLDKLEEEGRLYAREMTSVCIDGNEVPSDVFIYVYMHPVEEAVRVPYGSQPWINPVNNADYVWYACYGSNMLYERFMEYIEGGCKFNSNCKPGCDDRTPPVDFRPVIIPYNMYYGNLRSSWGAGGVAFLDTSVPGRTKGRMYLVTRKQFAQIHRQEGRGGEWYDTIVHLGSEDGIEILTFTTAKKRPECEPSPAYLDIVRKGMTQAWEEDE